MGHYALFAIACLINLIVSGQSNMNQLLDKGYSELENGNFRDAKQILEKATTFISNKTDLREKAILFNNLGVCYYQLGEFKKGIDQYTHSLILYRKLGNDTLIAESLLNLGLAYKDIGSFDRATKTILNAAAIFERIKNEKALSSAWNAIGNIQRKIGNFNKSLEYHHKALKIRQQIHYLKGIADSYNNIGSVYLDFHQPDKAEWYLQQALKLKKELGNEWNSMTTLTLLGQLYLELDKPKKAFEYLNAAYNMRMEAGNTIKIASSLYYLGSYYSKTKELNKAVESFRQAEILANELNDQQLLANVLLEEIELLKNQNVNVLLTKYQKLTIARERVVFEENQKEIARLEIAYDVERKNREIKLQKKQAKISRIELENQQLYSQRLVTWLIGTLLVTMFIIVSWYLLRKRKLLIETQKNELEIQKEEIINLHSELSHRTKNYFGMLSGILKSDKSNVTNPETIQVLEENIRRLDAMSLIQHYLLDDSTKHNKEVRLDSYLNNLIDLLLLNLLSQNHSIQVKKDLKMIYVDYDIAMRLAIVLNELVCNAVEHGLEHVEDAELQISVIQKQKRIHLTISDNGTGISEEYLQKSNTKGLNLIGKLLQKINGSIDFKNQNGCTAEVVVQL
ncbi:tetratricopeptide repeat protein [Fluviicola taffensis]|uniref:tetratricopeptide repeat protein n=1 Tax=Fluviicola taffensis TaxID=191579 RepID=UPI0031380CA6